MRACPASLCDGCERFTATLCRGRWPRIVPCPSPVPLAAASPWPRPTCSGSRKRPRSGPAWTRRTRPRQSCSEEYEDHLLARQLGQFRRGRSWPRTLSLDTAPLSRWLYRRSHFTVATGLRPGKTIAVVSCTARAIPRISHWRNMLRASRRSTSACCRSEGYRFKSLDTRAAGSQHRIAPNGSRACLCLRVVGAPPRASPLIPATPLPRSVIAVTAVPAMHGGRVDDHVLVDPELAHARIVGSSGWLVVTALLVAGGL